MTEDQSKLTVHEEIRQYIIDNLEYWKGSDLEELHYHLFNEDYYIIGTWKAEQFLNRFNHEGYHGIFGSIDYIKEYEEANFGEVGTDLTSSESVANMLAYIIGEEILQEIDMDMTGKLTSSKVKKIKEQIE